ncbi:alpha/beta-hydrolase [Lepidopterella palustris CBS 459.81]|uniref:Alpha/beta-hydrolase n=1 Tax=Lepidopterella palustris CBS 459.81 TaxID=1314670 RepID=A0A8E2EBZ2_9PEZI|nr:alpha/beta-hydrolase [Lepidopterella palustris CBS 459.81]
MGDLSLSSDLYFNLNAFHPDALAASTKQLNDALIERCKADKKWYTIGAAEYRKRRAAGHTPFPPAPKLDHAVEFTIKSARGGHEIPVRVLSRSAETNPKGVYYHIHGGGFVIGAAAGQDLLLDEIAKKTGLVVVSVEYRLAPEHPFPAGPEDCFDVADWLVANARSKFNSDLKFIGGESAGATLTALTLLHLRRTNNLPPTLLGAIFNYGCFDLSYLPSVRALDPSRPLILSYSDALHFASAFLPGRDAEGKRLPDVSALYNDVAGLGSAFFLVGTEDGLVDDTVLMSAKWRVAGNEAVVKFAPGAPHGFMTFDGAKVEITRLGWDWMVQYIQSKLCCGLSH